MLETKDNKKPVRPQTAKYKKPDSAKEPKKKEEEKVYEDDDEDYEDDFDKELEKKSPKHPLNKSATNAKASSLMDKPQKSEN